MAGKVLTAGVCAATALFALALPGPVLSNDVPQHAVMAFNLPACPKGWLPFAPADNRVVLGQSAGATTVGQQGGAPEVLSPGGVRIRPDNLPPQPAAAAAAASNGEVSPSETIYSAGGPPGLLGVNEANEALLYRKLNGRAREDGKITWSSGAPASSTPPPPPPPSSPNTGLQVAMPWVSLLYCEKQ